MKIYDLEQGSRRAAVATLAGVPLVYAALVALWIVSGGKASFMIPIFFTLVAGPFAIRLLWTGIRTWTEVTPDGITWSTPSQASARFSPSGSVPADRIAAISVTPYNGRSKPTHDTDGASTFAVVVHMLDRERVVLPVTCGHDKVSRPMSRLLDALAHLPDVPPVDISALAGLPHPREHGSKRNSLTR
jgi:hypothetical protein